MNQVNKVKQSYDDITSLIDVLCAETDGVIRLPDDRKPEWHDAKDKFVSWMQALANDDELYSLLCSIAAQYHPKGYESIVQLTFVAWRDDLQDIPKGAIQYAWQCWRRQSPTIMPTSGALRLLCVDILENHQKVHSAIMSECRQVEVLDASA